MVNTVWLSDVSSEDVGIVGLKGSKFCYLYQNSFYIPHCFIITIQAFQYFLEDKYLIKNIKKILSETNEDKESLLNSAETIQELILNSEFPDSLKEDINYAYEHMNMNTDIFKMLNKNTLNFIKAGRDFPYVAIRPSFNIKDLKAKNFTNVKGKNNLMNSIKQSWASLFNSDNILKIKNHNIEDLGFAIIVQKMINSEKYAIVNVNRNELTINCVYGLGETFNITVPDSYIVNANSLDVINKIINKQEAMFIRDDNYERTIRKNINKDLINKEKLSYDEIRKISNFSLSVFNHYNKNVNVEVAIENGKFYLIDVNDALEIQQDYIKSIEPQNETTAETINESMFSMFNESTIPQTYENQPSYIYSHEKQNTETRERSSTKKVPISFDIKITDETNIEELKLKLKAIKDFINQEF